MQISAEVRWFWDASLSHGVQNWFRSSRSFRHPVGGGQGRVDEYLRDTSEGELGIKVRGGKPGVEVKGLVCVLESLSFAGSTSPIQIWTKWTSSGLSIPVHDRIVLPKQRWLRKFDTSSGDPIEVPLDQAEKPTGGGALPSRGCNVEFTLVERQNEVRQGTFALEAFGSLSTIVSDIKRVASLLLHAEPPDFTAARAMSYPHWLKSA